MIASVNRVLVTSLNLMIASLNRPLNHPDQLGNPEGTRRAALGTNRRHVWHTRASLWWTGGFVHTTVELSDGRKRNNRLDKSERVK